MGVTGVHANCSNRSIMWNNGNLAIMELLHVLVTMLYALHMLFYLSPPDY